MSGGGPSVNRKTSLVCAVALLILCSGRLAGQGPGGAGKENPDQDLYPDSVAGLHSQMDELIHLVNLQDQQAFLTALDTLAIPKLHDWLEVHFPIYAVDGLQKDYEDAFAGYRSHVWWVMGNFAKDPAFGLKVEASEIPEPLAETGLEALLPRPDGGVRVENYRISPTLSKPPSWVSSFVYVDGRFRFVGGTYPFWNEKLTPLRGPMAIPAKSIGDLAIQGVPMDVDPKTPDVVAIVVLDVSIAGDGRAHGFRVKSGDPQYIREAEDYVRDWKFFPMATTFSMNVVFFNTKR
jgi:hypothetical protein